MTDEEFLNAIAIEKVIGYYLRVESFGRKFRAICPFHDDHKPSLQIDHFSSTFRCWGCGETGSSVDFVMRIEQVSRKDAIEGLRRRFG